MGIVGIVPAAGFATRLGRASGSKEALVVGGRPLIGYLLDRLAIGGADRVRVVTRPAKHDVVELVRSLGHELVLAEPETVGASIIAALRDLAADDVVLLGFPDSIWEPADGFRRVRARLDAVTGLALGLFRTDEPRRSDVVSVDPADRVIGIEIKPERPTSDWIWGCFAARAGVLGRLDATEELSAFLLREARANAVPAVRLGRLLDVGTPEALEAAERHPLVRVGTGRRR